MLNPIIHELFQKYRLLTKEVNSVLKKHDLFAAQWSVIYCIDLHTEMTLTQIWKYLNVEAPTITRTVNRLEEMGWLVTREGKDRREKIVRLSEEAIQKLPHIKETIIQFESDCLNRLTREEENQLILLLRKIDGKEVLVRDK
ncbi:MarR family transcriptional regulator [Sporosarcina saromensis]|uniref:MarR family transcriptional regulator n=1 Tax=Sporosarcina saromensis TaxID=359365 RepID=A0ABU4G740_9BACL|nr:MarR family transcriptional regulator [Sporosarcina saromensis]MDW0112798.1 MarR family transcriptional regulator [Sporosarcina saromensis]